MTMAVTTAAARSGSFMEEVTANQRQMWAAGDFHVIARQVMPAAEALVYAIDPPAGARVLDVACGSGNAALVAARRYCRVTGLDYVPALLERGRRRAEAEGSDIELREGDAQALPFPDGSFDVVVSTFGVMFAADQRKAAQELMRVCRPGGVIGLTTWPEQGAVADFFALLDRFAPSPAGLASPLRWGAEGGLRELLGQGITSLRVERRSLCEHFLSAEHAAAEFCAHFGPCVAVLAGLDDHRRQAFRRELRELMSSHRRGAQGTVAMVCDYTLAIASVK
jgi:SAM-dependent methyltransferase